MSIAWGKDGVAREMERKDTYRAHAVLAHTPVHQGVGIALVLQSGLAGHAGQLGADVGALGAVLLAPVRAHRLGHAVGVDAVRVVELGLVLSGGEAGSRNEAESDGGAHGEGGSRWCWSVGEDGWVSMGFYSVSARGRSNRSRRPREPNGPALRLR